MKNLLWIVSNSRDPIIPSIRWRKKVAEKIHCNKCYSIDRSRFPEPLNVVLDEYPDGTIGGGVAFTGISIYHRDFICQICKHLSDFVLGKCLDQNGNVIEEYVTCYGKDYIVLRGNEKTKYKICEKCGTIGPDGWPKGSLYTLRSYLTDSQVYQDCSCFMFLDEDLALKLDFSPWPDAELDPIAIRDEPIDGQHLPCDPAIDS